jgi:hypothetical protein
VGELDENALDRVEADFIAVTVVIRDFFTHAASAVSKACRRPSRRAAQ